MLWSRQFPVKDGWYWIRYQNKRSGDEVKTVVKVWFATADYGDIALARFEPESVGKETITHWGYIEEPGSPYAS